MNNAVFGKTMENVRNWRATFNALRRRYGVETMIEPNFHNCSVFSENLVAMRKLEVKFDKPIYGYVYSWHS